MSETSNEEVLQEGAIYAVTMNLAAKDKAWTVIKWATGILAVIAIYQSSYTPLLWLILIVPAAWYWFITSARRFVRTTTGMPDEMQAVAFRMYAMDDKFKALVRARCQQLKSVTKKL
jgi:hypothetical protein